MKLAYEYLITCYLEIATEKENFLPQRRTISNKYIRSFGKSLVIESLNTIHVLFSIIQIINGSFSLYRIGSNLLEHYFGLIRMRSKNANTWSRMLKDVTIIELFNKLKSEMNMTSAISGLAKSIGSVLIHDGANVSNTLMSPPLSASVAFHMMFNHKMTFLNNKLSTSINKKNTKVYKLIITQLLPS